VGCPDALVIKVNVKLTHIIEKKIAFFSAVFRSPSNAMGVCLNMIQPSV
jgi:hypothetical protein